MYQGILCFSFLIWSGFVISTAILITRQLMLKLLQKNVLQLTQTYETHATLFFNLHLSLKSAFVNIYPQLLHSYTHTVIIHINAQGGGGGGGNASLNMGEGGGGVYSYS